MRITMIDETFPTLRHFFGAYLNLDWPETYGSPAAAAEAYAIVTPQIRRENAIAEIDTLIGQRREPKALIDFLFELGNEYLLDPLVDDPVDFLNVLRAKIAM